MEQRFLNGVEMATSTEVDCVSAIGVHSVCRPQVTTVTRWPLACVSENTLLFAYVGDEEGVADQVETQLNALCTYGLRRRNCLG